MINDAHIWEQLVSKQQMRWSLKAQTHTLLLQVWHDVLNDISFNCHAVKQAPSLLLPSWSGLLDQKIFLRDHLPNYRVIAVDGSQIYPDRHEGLECALIHVGGIELVYGQSSTARVFNEPHVIAGGQDVSVETIDSLRQEYELKKSLDCVLAHTTKDSVILFDGSLIFWHLAEKPTAFRDEYLTRYAAVLARLYEQRIAHAGYVSLPHNKDLVNILRVYASARYPELADACALWLDRELMADFLAPGQRTIVFQSNASLLEFYESYARPYFFYVHTGHEIGRVEVPQWIAQDPQALALIEHVVMDQCRKGEGYPVALAEAHQQAVVTYADRARFCRMVQRLAIGRGLAIASSIKLAKKRRLSV